jgi:hypothetical protein
VVTYNSLVANSCWDLGNALVCLPHEICQLIVQSRLTCTYAHRMQNTRGHAPILEVLAAAGVEPYKRSLSAAPRSLYFMSEEDEAMWIATERRSLEKLRERKRIRRHERMYRLVHETSDALGDSKEKVIKEEDGEENCN